MSCCSQQKGGHKWRIEQRVQEMYLQSVSDGESIQHRQAAALNAKLDALATTEVLAISRPPASFPLPSPHADPASITHAVKEIEALRRQLADAQQQLATARRERDSRSKQLDSAEVRSCCD